MEDLPNLRVLQKLGLFDVDACCTPRDVDGPMVWIQSLVDP